MRRRARGGRQMEAAEWQKQKVHGRDEVLLDIEDRANAYSNAA